MNMTYNVLFRIDVEARSNIFSGHVISTPPQDAQVGCLEVKVKKSSNYHPGNTFLFGGCYNVITPIKGT